MTALRAGEILDLFSDAAEVRATKQRGSAADTHHNDAVKTRYAVLAWIAGLRKIPALSRF